MLNFLKPTFWKILLSLVLFAATSFLWRAYVISRISDTFPIGFPLQFYLAWGPCPTGQNCSEFNGTLLLLDAVIWYTISAWTVHRLRAV